MRRNYTPRISRRETWLILWKWARKRIGVDQVLRNGLVYLDQEIADSSDSKGTGSNFFSQVTVTVCGPDSTNMVVDVKDLTNIDIGDSEVVVAAPRLSQEDFYHASGPPRGGQYCQSTAVPGWCERGDELLYPRGLVARPSRSGLHPLAS